MADRSAAVLVDVLLADDAAESERVLTEQLAADPPLVLWTVCLAGRREEPPPRSVADVAKWLHEHLLGVLRWDDLPGGKLQAAASREAEGYADRVGQLLQIAELAALLAASHGEAAAKEAFLLGLLHDAPKWQTRTMGTEAKPSGLPQWLLTSERTPPGSPAAEAPEILAGKSAAAPADFDPAACRRRAMEARGRWLEPLGGTIDRLPALVLRLARLRQLETRFEETVETEKLESLAEFAAGAGHEINNPLAIIGGRAQLLLRDETDPERRRELALMNAQVKRAHEMIADVRLFARPPKPEPEIVDLAQLVDQLVGDFTPQAAKRAVAVHRTGDDGPLEIEADPAQINVALRALCKNALEAIGRDGRIEISLRASRGHVELRVSDDGPGIPAEHRRHVFDPFYSARQAGRGLGFGLSKCWRIVTNHGGRIDVQSGPGQGAAFTITLPLRQPSGSPYR